MKKFINGIKEFFIGTTLYLFSVIFIFLESLWNLTIESRIKNKQR